MTSPDHVCVKSADAGVKIRVADLDSQTVLIEGTREGLLFLAELLTAQANFGNDDGFQLSPRGAGNTLFTPDSSRGLYIHRKSTA